MKLGRQTLREQLGSGSRNRTAIIVIPTKSAKQISWSRRDFFEIFLINDVEYFPVPSFLVVSGNLRGKVPEVDDVLSSHEQEAYPTIPLDENCIEFDFQTGRNYSVDLRQTYLAVKLKFVKSCCFGTYNTKENKKEHKEETKADEEATAKEEQEAPVPLVTHVNNILHSFFSNVEVYIINQQIYNSDGLYVHKSYISYKFKGANSDYRGVLHCEVYDYEDFPNEIMEAPLS